MTDKIERAGATPPALKANSRPWIYLGLFFLIAIFGVLGSWASTAPISSAVIAQGKITVDGKRKAIQHLEGGIVKDLPINDGDIVKPGQTLIELDPIRARASLSIVETGLDKEMATEARLLAELNETDKVDFPRALLDAAARPDIAALIESQTRLFQARRDSLAGETEILQQRVAQLTEEIKGLHAEREAKVEQIRLIGEELRDLKSLLDRGQTTRTRVLALERAAAALKGEEGALIASIARAEKSIGETKLQIIQRKKDLQRDANEELQQVQLRLRDLRERAVAARDVLRRITITAPIGGTVVNMNIHTIGAVIMPGDTVMEIVPGKNNLIVEVSIRPQDIDNVNIGQLAKIRILAFNQRTAPTLDGNVIYVSADSLEDSNTRQQFYIAHIEVPDTELQKLGDLQLKPGMQTEVMIQTGERTAFQYILQPVIDSMNRAMREE